MCKIMVMGLLYGKCVLYGLCIQWLFVVGTALMGGHYRTDIISGVGHSRSNSIVLLLICMVACIGWGIDIILQVSRDSANLIEKG
jgi:hypothetical protein